MVEYWVVVPRDAGSNPVSPVLLLRSVAQWLEHGSVKPGVAGSSPVGTFLGVAELVDAIALGAVNYGFKSRRPLFCAFCFIHICFFANLFS